MEPSPIAAVVTGGIIAIASGALVAFYSSTLKRSAEARSIKREKLYEAYLMLVDLEKQADASIRAESKDRPATRVDEIVLIINCYGSERSTAYVTPAIDTVEKFFDAVISINNHDYTKHYDDESRQVSRKQFEKTRKDYYNYLIDILDRIKESVFDDIKMNM
ncbi:MAG: hypothetical protein GXP04_12170 [Alphaproteobacteria bacterium]|nr:hypothetical protein [Alphaproteobacteria bacterium]